MINVGIIGAGLIGKKRAEAIKKTKKGRLIAVADKDRKKAETLAREFHCESTSERSILRNPDIDTVIIAVPNVYAAGIARDAAKHKKNILCEKPLGINSKESKSVLEAARKSGVVVGVGFNHRFHPAVQKAKKVYDEGKIGKILLIRAVYGHGGRQSMEREWRAKKSIAGGGELLDQGVHIVDLCRWFGGEVKEAYGKAEKKFWPTEVEDNAFALMKLEKGIIAQFHVSWTNWKNKFEFEVFGTKGFVIINGLGGSYGKETLTFGKRKPKFGIPAMRIYTFEKDTSWEEEWKDFADAIKKKRTPMGNGEDGLKANKIIEALYASSRTNRVVRIKV